LDSDAGLPIKKLPPGIGTSSNFSSVPGIVSTYAFIEAADCGGGSCGADHATWLGKATSTTAVAATEKAFQKRLTFK
jgi:hypothetical protein